MERKNNLIICPSPGEISSRRKLLWSRLQDDVSKCRLCPLAETRNRTVFGEGPMDTSLMFVGEGPGADEDEQGIPFVGKAGQLLTTILSAAGINRGEVFIGNVVKCRPPGNRVPSVEEMMTCDTYLQAQIALISPRILVLLGSTPTRWVLKTTAPIGELRGRWFMWRGIEVFPMYHPSYLLRNQSRAAGSPKDLTWKDIREIKKRWDEVRNEEESRDEPA
jgi:uracil-DNA glycosylase family 4